MSYIGRTPTVGNFQICDAISTVNNQAAYTMQVGSVNVLPETANHMIVSLNGVIQAPISSYTVSGSTITFAANLVTGDVINFIQILGDVLDLGVPSDGTVTSGKIANDAVTLAKMASGTDGNIISYDASGNPVAIATGNDGQVLTSTGAGSPPAFETPASAANTPAFSVGKSGNQSIDNAETMTKVTFNVEHLDSNNTFASNKFTPGVAGEYFISFNFRVECNADNEVNIVTAKIYKNGSILHNTDSRVDFRASPGRGAGVTATALVNMDTDDYIEFYGGNNASGGTSTIQYRGTLAQGFKIIT